MQAYKPEQTDLSGGNHFKMIFGPRDSYLAINHMDKMTYGQSRQTALWSVAVVYTFDNLVHPKFKTNNTFHFIEDHIDNK